MSTSVNDGLIVRRMLLAAAVSGALHAGVIAFGVLHAPAAPEQLPPLEVQVVTVAPEATPSAGRPLRSAPVPRTAPSVRKLTAATPASPQPNSGATDGSAAEETPIAEEPTVAEAPTPAAEEPEVVATAPATTVIPEPPSIPDFPRSGRIKYDLLYGNQRFPVARTVQSWKIDGTRYQLASRSDTIGLADFLRSQQLTYLSRGELTPEGLRPEIFLVSRDRGKGRGIEEARAQFHWTRGTVTLGSATRVHEESLPAGSQDWLSFIYQLSIDPPATGRRHVTITNGTRIRTYAVEVLPEEQIETPRGVLRTIPVRQVRNPGAESYDVWLAVDHRYLPVRIRIYGRDGEPAGEQIVTEIQLGQE